MKNVVWAVLFNAAVVCQVQAETLQGGIRWTADQARTCALTGAPPSINLPQLDAMDPNYTANKLAMLGDAGPDKSPQLVSFDDGSYAYAVPELSSRDTLVSFNFQPHGNLYMLQLTIQCKGGSVLRFYAYGNQGSTKHGQLVRAEVKVGGEHFKFGPSGILFERR